jgi:hypothetical protein
LAFIRAGELARGRALLNRALPEVERSSTDPAAVSRIKQELAKSKVNLPKQQVPFWQ